MRRRAFTLIEVVLASALLAASLTTVFGLITWSRRVATQSARKELAQTIAADTMARLAGEPFGRLQAAYGAGTAGQTDPRRDPVLARAAGAMAGEPGAAAMEVRADFRPLPTGPGYLQVSVSFPVEGGGTDQAVMSRLLPTPALSGLALDSGRDSLIRRAPAPLAGADASPRTRANDQLYLEVLPRLAGSAAAALLELAMSADRRDGKYDQDWTQLAGRGLSEDQQWQALERGMSLAQVPDGVYALTEDRFARGGRTATLLTLRDMDDRERFVLLGAEDRSTGALTVGTERTRDLGDFAITGLFTDEAAAPSDPAAANVLATAQRVLVRSDRFDTSGRRLPFARRAGLFTAEDPLDPFAASASLARFLPRAARLAGLALEPKKLVAVEDF